jgi:arylsulfatase A-like enzyme/tetratricopeptide (TPR) repeat protein
MRIPIVAALAALLLLPACNKDSGGSDEPATEAQPRPTGPSVLLITLDTTRADRLGVYGNPQGATPTMDALAGRGVTWRRAFAHTPLTIPSHVTMFTGQYPDRHGVRDNGDHFLSEDAVTLAERFQNAGYATAASVGAYVTNHKWGFGQGFDDYYDHIPANYEMDGSVWASERRGDAVVADMVQWLQDHPGEPFFGWVHLFDPHHPYAPPGEFGETWAKRPYLGEVAFVDAQIAVLLETLEQLGVADQTAVMIAGDHGEAFGNHGEHQHGIFVYNATMHVPLILAPAGGMEPVMIEEAVGLIDVAPTLVAVAGLDASDAASAFDGVDLSGGLRGEEPERRALYGESNYVRYHFGWSEQRMMVEWPYKYVASTRPELFDIDDDPQEHEDLSETQAEVVQRLAALLAARGSSAAGASTATVDAETQARLEALGYVATRVAVDEGAELPDPKDKMGVLARFARAQAAMRAGNGSEARELFEQVVAEEPQLVDPRASLAQICMRQGDLDEAMAQLEEADRLAPGKSNILGLQANVLAVGGDIDAAMLKMEQALAVDDQNARAWTRMLQILFESHRYPDVLVQADRADAALPGVPAVAGYRGAAMVALGRYEDARPLLDRAMGDGSSPPSWTNFAKGVMADADGDKDASAMYFLKEYEAWPEHMEALHSAVLQLEQIGRSDEVLLYAHQALVANQANAEMHRAYGQALFNHERYDEARTATDACLAIDPEQPDCTMLLANVLAKQGQRELAEEAFKRAVELKRATAPPGVEVEGVQLD